ncbi:MAG TPA: hypothetical protein VFV38_23225 [Ktedonobacteraceae bacterium]|nr:hypothetical protein [Ktedonobacteraceae bacterium]
MGAIGTYICKSRVYDAVQEIKQCFPEIQREQIFDGLRLPASRGEIMSVKCCGKWRQFSITTDPTGGLRFLLKIPLAVEVQVLVPRFESLATAMGAQVLVNDNAYQESVK